MEELCAVCVIIIMVAGTIIAVCAAFFSVFLICSVIKELIEELFF